MTFNFSSFHEFLAFSIDGTAQRIGTAARTSDRYFTGTDSFDEAVRLATEGWPEGREATERLTVAFEPLIGSRVKRAVMVNAIEGFVPDVGAFCAGEPECMFTRKYIDADASGRILKIRVSAAYRCDISPRSVIVRGAMICALVDALEKSNYRVEVEAAFTSAENPRGGGLTNRNFILLKASSEPLEIDRLAFALAHASMFRRLVFSVRERDLEYQRAAEYGYSYDDTSEGCDLFIPTIDGEVREASAVAWFTDRLKEMNITFEE